MGMEVFVIEGEVQAFQKEMAKLDKKTHVSPKLNRAARWSPGSGFTGARKLTGNIKHDKQVFAQQ